MSWRRITKTDIKAKLSASELTAFGKAAIASGDADPIEEQIDQITDKVRGYIITSGADLGETGTMPERLIPSAVDALVINIMSRAAGIVVDPNEVRRNAGKNALRLFEQVANGDYAIDDPVTGETASSGGASVVGKRRSRVNRRNLRAF